MNFEDFLFVHVYISTFELLSEFYKFIVYNDEVNNILVYLYI